MNEIATIIEAYVMDMKREVIRRTNMLYQDAEIREFDNIDIAVVNVNEIEFVYGVADVNGETWTDDINEAVWRATERLLQ